MKITLKSLFPLFVKTLADAEHIDNVKLNGLKTISNPKKADYFFDSRKIICEQKSLDNNMLAKFDETLNKFKDSETLKKKVYDKLTKSIAGIFETAHDQINITKQIFTLPHSKGVLLILNETSYLFSPNILMRKVSEMFNKRTPTGNLRYKEIIAAWIIQFSHNMQLTPRTKAFPMINLLNNIGASEPDLEYVANYLETLEKAFAKFLKIPFLTDTIESANFEPNKMPSIKIQ
jgi:hypothetical protein